MSTQQTGAHAGSDLPYHQLRSQVSASVAVRPVKRIKSHSSVLSHSHQRRRRLSVCIWRRALKALCLQYVCALTVCMQACVHETIALACSHAVCSSEMRQGHMTLQALINSTLIKGTETDSLQMLTELKVQCVGYVGREGIKY